MIYVFETKTIMYSSSGVRLFGLRLIVVHVIVMFY